ncbi:MAG: nitroreductase [Bauldia sp.]
MPDALQLLKTRTSVAAANLSEPAPSDEQVNEMLAIAMRVPDHGKLTPWRFIVFKGEARFAVGLKLAELRLRNEPDISPGFIQQDKMRLAQAPLAVAVVSRASPHVKIPEWEQAMSAGAATMNLLLAAHAMGFAANWLTGWFCYDEEGQRILGLRPGEKVAGIVHIGTPNGPALERPRVAVASLTTAWQG